LGRHVPPSWGFLHMRCHPASTRTNWSKPFAPHSMMTRRTIFR
jgi:hypothetical protein